MLPICWTAYGVFGNRTLAILHYRNRTPAILHLKNRTLGILHKIKVTVAMTKPEVH
jgi:hypothetical protein